MARMNVVFEDALLEEMRELVPSRQRSGFIEEAVRARLAQLRQIRAVEAAAGAWTSEGRGDPSQEIEEVRHAWDDRQRRTDG
jgi:metal-responsive CopG/Arc/MetJ family transcriptional regulator